MRSPDRQQHETVVAFPMKDISRPVFFLDGDTSADNAPESDATPLQHVIAGSYRSPERFVSEQLRKTCRTLKMAIDVPKQWTDRSDYPTTLMFSFFVAVLAHWTLTVLIYVVGNYDHPYLSQIPAVVYSTLVAIGFLGTWFQGLTFMTVKTAQLPSPAALLTIPVFLANVHCFVPESMVPFNSRFKYTIACIPWMTCVLWLYLS
jgi:hypothetical protein